MSEIEIFINKFFDQEGYRLFFEGLTNTAIIAVSGLLIGFLIGSVVAIVKLIPGKNPVVAIFRAICDIYVAVFRGTPMMVQLLILFYQNMFVKVF